MAKGYFSRSPWEHARMGFQAAPGLAWDAVRDSTGIAYGEGAYHKIQQRRWKGLQSQLTQTGNWTDQHIAAEARFHKLRASGFTEAGAVYEMEKHLPGFTGTPVTSRMTRSGHIMGSVAFAANAYYAFHHSFGPLYGGAVGVASTVAGMVGPRLGWGLGSAVGAAIGGPLAPATALVGGIIGGLTGMILAPMAIDAASVSLPKLGFRLSRRGFGNLNGPYQDTQQAHSMRQAAVAAISQSHMNARNALGGEAALLHFS